MTTPRKKPPAKPAPKAEEPKFDSLLAKYAEKFGIYPAILIAGGYFVFAEVVKPVAETYDHALQEIKQSNEDLKAMVKQKSDEDLAYGKQVVEHLDEIEKAIKEGIQKLERYGNEHATSPAG
jgi:demethoxyubiquinone hydroxylase (CLK1/Coq7/Cat5 family)